LVAAVSALSALAAAMDDGGAAPLVSKVPVKSKNWAEYRKRVAVGLVEPNA
jgi:hypothetical protein